MLTNDELIRDISERQPGSVARLRILRDGRPQTVVVKLAERPLREGEGEAFGEAPARPRGTGFGRPLGVSVRDMDGSFIDRNSVPETVRGVVVTGVDPAGPSHQALRAKLVILEINRRATRSVLEYQRLIKTFSSGDVVAIYYYDPQRGERGLVSVMLD